MRFTNPASILGSGRGHALSSPDARGLRWWEIDITYYVLKALGIFGIVRNMRKPPAIQSAG